MEESGKNILYPELSYAVVGAVFCVFNQLGYGLLEKYYQRALAEEFSKKGIQFTREQYIDFKYDEASLGKLFLDFVVENKIVIECKVRPRLGYVQIQQVATYLKATGYQLAILIWFTPEGVKYRRVLRPQ